MKFGYARVSTPEQILENQISNLEKAACEKIFTDKVSGAKSKRPGFDSMSDQLRSGDTVTVTSLDRLGRSSRLLIQLLEDWGSSGINIHILSLDLDTSTPTGKLTYAVMAAMAECERNLMRERTIKGLEGARARGRKGGRRCKLNDQQATRMIQIYHEKRLSIQEIGLMYNVGKGTIFNYINKAKKS